jgi:HK97 family phage major capsid protein
MPDPTTEEPTSVEELAIARERLLARNNEIYARAKEDDGRDLSDEELCEVEANQIKEVELGELADHRERQAVAQAKNQEALASLSRPRGPRSLPKTAVTEKVKESVQDDPKLGFAHLGEFGRAVMDAYSHGGLALDHRLQLGAAITGMGTKVGKDGGFAVPTEFAGGIWENADMEDLSNVIAQTDQYVVEAGKVVFLRDPETSRADGSRAGGIRGYWKDEGGTLTASDVEIGEMTLEPKKLTVLSYMTSELLEQNNRALDQYLSRKVGKEIRFKANDALFNGNGVGKPVGVISTADCTVSVSAESGQAAATIESANIDKMWGRMHPRARMGAAWYINVDCEPQLAGLNRPVGTGGELVYNPPGGLSAAPYGTLKGRPVIPTEFNATLGTVGDIVLANFGWYASATRGSTRADTSIHVSFLTDQTAFRWIFYVDGQPWLGSAITPYKGTNTLTSFVTLATRS